MKSRKINGPSIIEAAGNRPKLIEEFAGRVNTGDSGISIARMRSPEGWMEPGQTPDFDEYTVVLEGILHIQTGSGEHDIGPDESFIAKRGEWVRYSTPNPGGAEYIAVCVPAFSPDIVHRDQK